MKKTWLLTIWVLLVALFVSSCEIGLGEAVDTQAPTISIEYPEISSIIRDSFILSGNCQDDYGLEKVVVEVNRTDTGKEQLVNVYEAEINDSQTSWWIELNQYDKDKYKYNGWEFADGTYNVKVTTTDKSGKKSQAASLTFDIDNTPPLMILSSPGIDDIKNATAYGTALTIKGNISDLHTASKLVMTVYKSSAEGEKLSVVGTYEETNLEKISDDGIVFAQKDGSGDKDDRFKEMYDVNAGGDQYYICEFTVYDNAKTYKASPRSLTDDDGNSTSSFYFTDDVYNAWLSKAAGLGYSDARKIVSSTFTGDYVTDTIETPGKNENGIDRENVVTHHNGKEASDYVVENLSVKDAVFTLNQDANPKYTVLNYSYNFSTPEVVSPVSGGAKITVTLTAGRNGTLVEPKTMKVYQFGPFNSVARNVADAIYANPVAWAEENPDLSVLIGDNSDYKSSSVDQYPYEEIPLSEDIGSGLFYIIAATGKDKDGNVADSNGYYVIKGSSSAIPPKIEWWTTDDNGAHGTNINSVDNSGVAGTSDLTFSGFIYPNGEFKSFTYEAEFKSDNKAEPKKTVTGEITRQALKATEVDGQYIWSFALKNGTDYFTAEKNKNYVVTLTLKAENAAETNVSVERTFTIDRTDPEVKITSVTPVVEETAGDTTYYYLNGKTKINGNITETNLKSVWYEIWVNGDSEPAYKSPDLGSTYFTIGEIIDTADSNSGCEDGKSLNIIFYAEDKAGNKSSYSMKEYNEGHDFVVKQSTDNPVITVTNSAEATTKDEIESYFDNSGNNKLNVSFSDDDGLKSVTVTVTKEDGSALTPAINKVPLTVKEGTTSASLGYKLPSADGIYKVSFTAIDTAYADAANDAIKAYRTTTWGPYLVGVDTGAPEVEITSHTGGLDTIGVAAMESGFDFKGTAQDHNGLNEIKIVASVKGQPDKVWSSLNADDGIVITGNEWKKHFTKTDLPDASYKFTVTATDIAGKTSSATHDFVIDTVKPVVREVTLNASDKVLGTYANAKNWYKAAQVSVNVVTEKDTSGVTLVEYSFNGNDSWNSFTKDTTAEDGATTWRASIPGLQQGENKIYVRATDTANNTGRPAEEYKTVYVDTKLPEVVLGKVYIDGVEKDDLSQGVSVNSSATKIEFIVTVNDIETGKTAETSSGVDKIYVTKIGNKQFGTAIEGVLVPDTTSDYKFALNKSDDPELNQLVSGYAYVKAYDKLGNESTESGLFEISSDVTNPVISIKGLSPKVNKNVNGTMVLNVSVSDNSLKEVWYEIESDGTKLKNTDNTTRFDVAENSDFSDLKISVDTTKCADNKTLNVFVHAEDHAGNTSEKNLTEHFANNDPYIVKQDTDIPSIRITTGVINENMDLPLTKDQVTTYYSNSGNGKINGRVTDDDDISSILITIKKEDGTDLTPPIVDKEIKEMSSNDITYELPEKDGYYQVTLTVKDSTWANAPAGFAQYRTQTVGPFFVGVDNVAPSLTEENYDAGKVITNQDIVLKGIAADDSGIKSLKIVADRVTSNPAEAQSTTWYANVTNEGDASPKLTMDADGNWTITCEKSEVPDGTYTFKITAEDQAKKTAVVERTFTKDIVPPVIYSTAVTTEKKCTIDSLNWYGSSQINIKIVTSDATSGVKTVEYSTDSGAEKVWNGLNKGTKNADSSVNWNGTVSCTNQGENKIYIKVTDEANNVTNLETPISVYIDTKSPSTLELVSVDNVEGFSGKKYVNANNKTNVVFVVKAMDTDGGTGIKSVRLTKIGNTEITGITGTPTATANQYEIVIPYGQFKTGSVFVEAVDMADNVGQETAMFQIENDTTPPVIDIKSISPCVHITQADSSISYNLNGNITVSASISDSNLKNVWYEVFEGAEEEAKTKSADLNALYTFNEVIDTTKYTDNSTLRIVIHAEDEAGNKATADSTKYNGNVAYKVNQSTDKPVFTPSNYTERATAAAIESGDWFDNKGNNKLIASVSDDDGLTELKVTVTDKDGNALSTPINNVNLPFTANTTSAAINYILPSTDGIYKIVFTAKDNTYASATDTYKPYRTISTEPFFVGVDTAAPKVEITSHGSGTNTIGKSKLVSGKFTISGTASDNNGITQVEITATPKTGAAKTWSTEDANSTVTMSNGNWSKEFTVGDGKDLPDGEYTITVTVSDPAGKTGSAERSFVIDTVDPTVSAAVSQTGGTLIGDNKWYGTSQIEVTATTSDATSGVSSVEYSTDEGESKNWNSFTKGVNSNGTTTWTAAVSCAEQGANKIYVRATDVAENKTSLSPITAYVDTKAPDECTLISVDGSTQTGSKLVNKKNNVSFIVEPKDDDTDGTGKFTEISSVKLIRIGTGSDWAADRQIEGTAVEGEDGKFAITISKEKLAAGNVWVKVTDLAGNSANFNVFTLEVDEADPSVTIAPISGVKTDNAKVLHINKTISVSGTGFDGRELAEVEVYYAIADSKPAIPADADKGNSTKWPGWTKADFEDGSNMYNWKVGINTNSAADTDGKNLYICAVAKDKAENIGFVDYNATNDITLTVNQDSDRPVIKLSNLKLTSSNGVYWHTSNELFGTVNDDDGTVKTVKYKIGSDGTLSGNIYENGMWNISGFTEGAKEIIFVIEDAGGTTFTSNAASTTLATFGPKIVDSNGDEKLGYTGTANDILNITIDTKSPTFGTPKAYVSDSKDLDAAARWDNSINNTDVFRVVGGSNNYMFIKVNPADDNGIKSTLIRVGDKTASADDEDAKVISTDSGVIVRFDLSKFTTGSKDVTVTVTDNAGKSSTEGYKLNIDNTAPVITYTTKNGSQMFASISNTVQGSTSDQNEVKELWYAITTSETELTGTALTATKPAADEYTKIAWPVPAENQISILNWGIHFDGERTTADEFHADRLYDYYKTINNKTDEELVADDNVKYFYLWTYATDECGNPSEPSPLLLNVLLNGDKPSISITYPANTESVGGTIRITGTTQILTSSVSKVYIQIDPSYDTEFNETGWKSELEALMSAKNVPSSYYKIVETGRDAPYDYGIEVSGTTAWSQSANDYGEFDPEDKTQIGKIAIRAFAVSASGKMSAAQTNVVEIDPNTPLIGNKTPLQLVQYETSAGSGIPCTDGSVTSGNVAARMDYKDDMYIKGIWFLTGSLYDDSGIKQVIVRMADKTTKTVVEDRVVKNVANVCWVTEDTVNPPTASGAVCKNYDINIKVGDNSPNDFGKLEYKISIQDDSNPSKGNDKTISLTYDNKAPDFSVTSTSSGANTEESAVSFKQIYQNNGSYTINGSFDEPGKTVGADSYNQSGFERVVMYYTRTLNKGTDSEVSYLIDPMISNGTTGTANRDVINTTNFVSATANATDGLYWRVAEGTVSNNILTVSSFKGSAYDSTDNPLAPQVRAGGLVKINNVIYRIKYVSGDEVTIDGELQNITTTEDVYFAAAALVVDNTVTETGTSSVYDPSKSTTEGKDHMSNGDGDQMVEGAVKNGTTYSWTASIDSSNILDGDVDVHFVAFDKAGNVKKDNTTLAGAKVANNAPRLAGVKFGTDLNGNGTVEDDELKIDYSNIYANVRQASSATGATANGKDVNGSNIAELNVAETDRLVVKGSMMVIPQVVGGNLGLGWQYTYKTAASGNAAKTTNITYYTGTGAQHSSDGSIRNGEDGANDSVYAINISTLDLLKLDSDNGIMAGEQTMKFTVVDKTEGGSLSASVNLPVNIVLSDTVAPTAVFRPFYWNSKDSNSLYNNSRTNGHIELEGDLPEAVFKSTNSTIFDLDPKVSGIISMDGVAKDNVLVKTIAANVNGTTYTIASRDENGVWTSGTGNANLLVLDDTHTYADYKFTGTGSQNWYFELVSDEFDLATGENTVTFRFHWNTAAMITTVAKADVAVTVTATDRGSISLNTAKTGLTYAAGKSSTPGTTQTTGAAGSDTNTGYYKMDVVPYITELITKLSSLESSTAQWAKTAYSRTALGYYPVAENEVIEVKGFNLGNETYKPTINLVDSTDAVNKLVDTVTPELVTDAVYYSVAGVPIGDNSSGEITIAVNGVANLNGSNDETIEYNIIDNGSNNATLNDDVKVKVWEFKKIAEPVAVERVMYPTVKMSPANGRIGASFANSYYFHMAGYGNNGSTWYSHTPFLCGYDGSDANSFTFDKNGYTYGGVQYRASDLPSQGGSFNFVFSTAKPEGDMSLADVYRCNTGSARLEDNCTNLRVSPTTDTTEWAYNKWRVKSPQFVAVANDDSTSVTVHSAYYDSTTKQIRYRKGVVNAAGLITKNIGFGDSGDRTSLGGGNDGYMIKGENDSLKDIWHTEATPTTGGYADSVKAYPGFTADVGSGGWDENRHNNFGVRHVNAPDSLQTENDQIIHVLGSNGLVSEDKVWDETVQLGSELLYCSWYNANENPQYYYTKVEKPEAWNVTAYQNSDFTARGDRITEVKGNKIKVEINGDWNTQREYTKQQAVYSDPREETITHVEGIQGIYKKTDTANNHTYANGAGKYVALGVVPSTGKAVIAWYDDTAKHLLVALEPTFTGDALNANAGTNFANSYARTDAWEAVTIDLGSGGEYVQMVVDSDDMIHIAHYDSATGGELKYVKLDPSKWTEEDRSYIVEQVTVDSYDDVGSHLTINVGKDAEGNQVPYIGYYGRKHAKMAYRVNYDDEKASGADTSHIFTHNWEVTYVPTADSIDESAENTVNVAVWTNVDGYLEATKTDIENVKGTFNGNITSAGDTVGATQVYANTSNNPIVAYVSASGSLDYAQIKGDSTEITFKQ